MTRSDDELQVHAERLREHRGMDAAQLRRQYDDMGAVNYPDDSVVILLAEVAATGQWGREAAKAEREVASVPLDEVDGWDELAEAMGAMIHTQGGVCEIKGDCGCTCHRGVAVAESRPEADISADAENFIASAKILAEPSEQRIRKLESERDVAEAVIAEISVLHRNNGGCCDHCWEEPESSYDDRHSPEPWPCATVRVIQDHAVPDG